jgi:anti-anti-sigma regulatory factor
MKLFLIVTEGRRKGLPIPITVDLFMIGSGSECQLRCTEPTIAPRLCAILTRGRKVFVRNLNNRQSVEVNGSPLPPGDEWPLHRKDVLTAGPLEFLLEFREKPLPRRDLEEWALGCLDQVCTREFDDPAETVATCRQHRPLNAAHAAAAVLDRLAAVRGEVIGRLRIGYEKNVTVIRFNDRYLVEEAELALVQKELRQHLARPHLRVLLDCKNVQRLSTAGAMMLDQMASWLQPWGSTLALCRVRAELQGFLRNLNFAGRILIFADKDAALTSRW